MTEEKKTLPTNSLTADELLQNKGIKYNAWDEYERSARTLPKTGMKQFEPDGSWLQNMQIEKGIKARKNLIAVERVDRISQLASAEWLPVQKRARVKKYSGQDWSSFGLEKNCALYLIPEEALFLLEANCLELTWNDIPLSVQQAYDLLIDNVECTMEEYRVYSQLVRYGYRIQRFIYDPENIKNDESSATKRKVIVEPENGLWMSDTQQQTEICIDIPNDTQSQKNINRAVNNPHKKTCQEVTKQTDILSDVHKVVEDLLCTVENTVKLDTTPERVKINENKKKLNSEVQIISDEILSGNIKIITEPINNYNKTNSNSAINWQSSRIQRNVKLLPKRTDKQSLPTDIPIIESSIKNSEQCSGKHKSSSPINHESQSKKSKHEVIELSDDEIQEVPQPMTRMELLNLIPNVASQSTLTVKISRGYIPHSIKPQRTVYRYENEKLRNLQKTDRRLRSNDSEYANNNINQDTLQCNNTSMSDSMRRNTHVATYNQNLTNIFNSNVFMQDYFSMERRQYTNFDPHYMYNNRMPYMYSQNSYWHHRNTMFQNMFVSLENHNTAIQQNRFMSVQMNNFPLPNINNNAIRSFYTRNQIYHNFHQNSLVPRRLYQQRIVENMSIHCSVARNVPHSDTPRQRHWSQNQYRNLNASSNCKDEVFQSSFKVLPGASSWSELKTKWRDEKTITIDDEEVEDCNEVQVVGQLRSPLIGSKNINNLEEAFSKLRIIKSAPEKTVRRKKSRYKISYNVYSNTQNYRKANPGPPLYRVIVIRQNDPFLQPIELHRLLQDANNSAIVLACVSMTISYIQPGFVSVPNLT
ncbi:tRNA splicing endonuclease subunit 54 [Calliopsis andreniformis]|uniref:tRNA splicing endonuclease subunit 54 n=1 Tax=Calliopsis andreniformis TaxID=337506 RepID=UPI003FCE7F84